MGRSSSCVGLSRLFIIFLVEYVHCYWCVTQCPPILFRRRARVPRGELPYSIPVVPVKQTNQFDWNLLRRVSKDKLAYWTIPIVAAMVGYITNYVGVWMLFYPLRWTGVPLKTVQGQPFGWLGWQGVVPAKRTIMANKLYTFTIARLVSISTVFGRLNPGRMGNLLTPVVQPVLYRGLLPNPLVASVLSHVANNVITGIEGLVDMRQIVVKGLTDDPSTLGRFFQRVGGKELSFLVNSGSYFGFILGIGQMAQMAVYPAKWTLPVAGALVGYVTNWIALKLIFEPVRPLSFGPFVVQGLFLRRQKEVSHEFSTYISDRILNSQSVWANLLQGEGLQKLTALVQRSIPLLSAGEVAQVIKQLKIALVSTNDNSENSPHTYILRKRLHVYSNRRIALRSLLTKKMIELSPEEFVQVLRPIFQEDEVILIAAGGVLGALAGGVQWWATSMAERQSKSKNATGQVLQAR